MGILPYVLVSLIATLTIVHAATVIGHPRIRINPNLSFLPLLVVSTVVAGLRYQTGGDWETYQFWFEEFSDQTVLSFGVEPGWILYSLALRFAGASFDTYVLITAILSNLLIWYGLSRVLTDRKVAILCFGFYCLIVFYSAQMFYVRAGLAAGLFLWAVAVSRGSKPKAFLLVLVAMSLHVGVALAALIYASLRVAVRHRLSTLVVLGLLASLFAVFSSQFLPEVYVTGEFADERTLSVKAVFGVALLATVVARLPDFVARFSPEAAALAIAALTIPYLFDSFEVGGRARMFFSPLDGLPIYFLVLSLAGRRYLTLPLAAASVGFAYLYWSNPYVQELFIPYRTWLPSLI